MGTTPWHNCADCGHHFSAHDRLTGECSECNCTKFRGRSRAGLTIWKFELRVDGNWTIEVPKGAEILHFAISPLDPGVIWVWALVEPQEDWDTDYTKMDVRSFRIFGTGHPVLPTVEANDHAATVVSADGSLVWHIFESEGPR